ncbi:unnamed protein product [Polarella glacialis]|uniref:J domain-containing protein n=1 Tax=Polarella glacialis TaxID=89957 RepID=A0A813HZ63_POLGL|nr:unnamed protein product [Polarella glacialis]
MSAGISVPDHYAVLGVSRSASPGSIRRAYRQKALATHPDKGGHTESFRLVVQAFETLGSAADRAHYDSRLERKCASKNSVRRGSKERPQRSTSTSKGPPTEVPEPGCRQRVSPRQKTVRRGSKERPQRYTSMSKGPPPAEVPEPSCRQRVSPRQKKRRTDPENRLATALDGLRTAIAGVTNRAWRGEMLQQLSQNLRQELLSFVERKAATPKGECSNDTESSQGGNKQSDKMSQQPCAQGCELAKGSDADSDTSSYGTSDASHFVCGEEMCKDPSGESAEEEIYALPWHPFNDRPGEEEDEEEMCVDEVFDCESGQGEAPPCGSATVTGTADANVGDLGFTFETGKQKHPVARGKKRESTGFTCYTRCGKTYYRSQTFINGIDLRSYYRPDLDSAVSDHVVLMQLREEVLCVFQRRGLKFNQYGANWQEVANELSEVEKAVLIENGLNGETFLCTYHAAVSMSAFIAKALRTPTTRSIVTCLEHLRLMQEARAVGWPEVRKAVMELSLHEEPGLRKCSAIRCPVSAASVLDALYDSYAAQREAREARLLKFAAQFAAQREAREARLLELGAAREEKRKHHEESVVRVRTLRRFSRLARRAETALNAVQEQRRRLAQLEDTQKKKAAAAQARQEQQERKQRAELRRHWLHRRDLTMEEILRGPPSF